MDQSANNQDAQGMQDDIMNQISMNQDYENELKKAINESMPFVSELQSMQTIQSEYENNKFEKCFTSLRERYQHIRRLRRDGNCFYRAFLFQIFEHFILTQGDDYKNFIKMLKESKDDLVKEGGYDLVAIEDFYDVFLEQVEKLKDVKIQDCVAHCMKVLCNHQEANYIIMYARFMAATYLKKNAVMFEDFVGDVSQFCLREVEQLDVECDQPQIIAITNYFRIGVEVNSVNSYNGSMDIINVPDESSYQSFRSKLLFMPGHYDALYK